MPKNPLPHNPMQQLSVGNVINVSINLYRANLKLYFKLALIAHLWVLVPIYGWAKFYAISALISRLAFGELIGQPESPKTAATHINRRLGYFFIIGILLFIFSSFGSIILSYLIWIPLIILLAFFSFLLKVNLLDFLMNLPPVILGILILVTTIVISFWFNSRGFMTDLPLAIESNISLFKTIRYSWSLTKSSLRQIQLIIVISFLTTLPTIVINSMVGTFIIALIAGIVLPNSPENDSLIGAFYLISLILVNGLVTMPFWQSIKAVVYYDLRCRRDGLDLKLRDSLSR